MGDFLALFPSLCRGLARDLCPQASLWGTWEGGRGSASPRTRGHHLPLPASPEPHPVTLGDAGSVVLGPGPVTHCGASTRPVPARAKALEASVGLLACAHEASSS